LLTPVGGGRTAAPRFAILARSRAERVLPRISRENLAEVVGAIRARVSHFMNEFRKLGLTDYGDQGGLTVSSGRLSVVLHDSRNPSGTPPGLLPDRAPPWEKC